MQKPTNIGEIERELSNINRVKNIVRSFIKLYPEEMKFHTKTFFKGVNKISRKLKAEKLSLKKAKSNKEQDRPKLENQSRQMP